MISQKDKENALLSVKPSEGYQDTPSFYETFSAGVGKVIDEELSISRSFNNEGYQQRQSAIQAMVDSGEIGREVIDANRDKRGRINYDRIAKALKDDRILTDSEIEQDKIEMLESRRQYANSVLDKGSALAGFLGQINSYMLDPVNIMAMGAGGAGVIKSGLSTGQAVFQAAARGGTIAAGSEALIQPFVHSYKNDIESPYTATDALSAIAMAAVGGAAIDSTITGISSYLKRVKGDIQKMEDAGLDVPQEVIAAKQKIDSIENQLVEEVEPQKWQAFQERDVSYSGVEARVKYGAADDYDMNLWQDYKNMPESNRKEYAQAKIKDQIEKQLTILKNNNKAAAEYNSPQPKINMDQKPRIRAKSGQDLTGNARVKKEMEENGTLDEYNAELAIFNEMEDLKIELDDYEGSAKQFAQNIDEEIETVEALNRCYIG